MIREKAFELIVQIIFGGGIVVYIFQLFREKKQKKKERETIIMASYELYREERFKNITILDVLANKCISKKNNPKESFESHSFYFNVINYILANLIELNVSPDQLKNLMEIKTSLENVLFWQDEYINGTKGDLQLMKDVNVAMYYLPRIEKSIKLAKELLITNSKLFSS
jgi:hypothetical protein